jgi:hypothetical protein
MPRQKLKIALLIESYNVAFWIYSILDEINKSNHFEIVLVITKKKSDSITKEKTLRNIWNNRNKALFQVYSNLEKKIFNKGFDIFQTKNLKTIINCNEIIVSTKKMQLNHSQLSQIASNQIDVIISFGLKELETALLNYTKNGIWYYHHGNYNIKSNKISGVWEVFNENDETKVTVNAKKKEASNELILYETAFNTDHLFIWRNRHVVFWNSKTILQRKLNELYKIGNEQFYKKKQHKNESKLNNKEVYKTPTNYETFKYVFQLYIKALRKVVKRQFYFNQWILLFSIESNRVINKTFKKYKRILPPKDRFWADPFILKRNRNYYIFFEELIYTQNRGKISVIEMDENGNYTKPKVVLETEYHLSYPFLIEDNGELYMIPETEQNRTIELYKCVEFPNKWELEKTLFRDLKAVDSTIFKYNDKYWLFTNLTEYEGEDVINELHLFYSEHLLSDTWTSHPQNPITTNHAFSRPAGNIFVQNNKVFRPAQNCSKHYGYGIQIQEIIKLTINEYEEKNCESIHPNWANDLISTHTINSSGSLTFIDAIISRKK